MLWGVISWIEIFKGVFFDLIYFIRFISFFVIFKVCIRVVVCVGGDVVVLYVKVFVSGLLM